MTYATNAKILKDLKIACIMDEFTFKSYSPESNFLPLTPSDCINQINKYKPDMLFIESAWEGINHQWHRKIVSPSQELRDLIKHCRNQKIPVVFWNKEDPVFFDSFLQTACLADFIFTTDVGCISQYKKEAKHERVYHLHFAAQPKIQNPIEYFPRQDKFCFAGAYYHKYKERSSVFDSFAPFFDELRGFDIYDRHNGKSPEMAFPPQYNHNIKGSLSFNEIDKAYKGYNYGINMNSVTQSQSMFARRVFELLLSNTIVVSNYSRGLKNYFGDLVICTDDLISLAKELNTIWDSEVALRKFRLLGLRTTLRSHLYEDRLDYITQKVFGRGLKTPMPTVAVITRNEKAIPAFVRQQYEKKILYIVSETEIPRRNILSTKTLIKEIPANFIAFFEDGDYYGENYLTDLMLASRFSRVMGIGKSGHYQYDANDKKIKLIGDGYIHKEITALSLRRGALRRNFFKDSTVENFLQNLIVRGNFISVDEFNYCAGFSENSCDIVDDMLVPDQGVTKWEEIVLNIKPSQEIKPLLRLGIKEVLPAFNAARAKEGITASQQNNQLLIKTNLPEGKPGYLYLGDFQPLSKYGETFYITLYGTRHMGMQILTVFYDENKNRLKLPNLWNVAQSPIELTANKLPNAKYFRITLRMTDKNEYDFIDIRITAKPPYSKKNVYVPRSEAVILTNIYPSPNNLYANMFVHNRMLSYKREHRIYEVMPLYNISEPVFRVYDGINVSELSSNELSVYVGKGYFRVVGVHFLNEVMWKALKPHIKSIRLLIWVHGFEIQPWWRRTFIEGNDDEKSIQESNQRMALWHDVFNTLSTGNIKLVFVSQYFANEVMEDYEVKLPTRHIAIIHNGIDTERFEYIPKNEEQRKYILSISSWSSAKYANDLSVQVVLALSKKTVFKNLRFHFIGNGQLFDELTEPIKHFTNVILDKRFMTHDEIKQLHKQYGIFLVPTRWDSQGVSRGEAMASGLVPITNSVSAIPEFCTHLEDSMLSPYEDWQGMADSILRLYNRPTLFTQLSKNAAQRIRIQLDNNKITEQELRLIEW